MNNKYTTCLGISSIIATLHLPVTSVAKERVNSADHGIAPIENNPAIRLDPTLHLRLAHGNTSLPADEVAFGGHDPSEDNFNFQGFEIGTNIHLGEYVSGFATVNIFKRDGEDFDSEFEEGFLNSRIYREVLNSGAGACWHALATRMRVIYTHGILPIPT